MPRRDSQSTRATPISSELNVRSGGEHCRATHSFSAFVSASNKIRTAGGSQGERRDAVTQQQDRQPLSRLKQKQLELIQTENVI